MIQEWDGYDHYNTNVDLASRSSFIQYQEASEDPAIISFPIGRNGIGKCINFSRANQSEFSWVFGQRVSSAFVGYAMNLGTSTLAAGAYFRFYDSVTSTTIPMVTIFFNPFNYSISVYRGNFSGTLLYTSVNNAWPRNVWNFIDIWPVIDSSAGSVKVWVKGTLVVNLTGADTGGTQWDVMTLELTPSSISDNPQCSIDDFYYGDTTTPAGAYPFVAPIGDSHTDTLFAVGNNAVQWTPLANTNYQEINETAMDSDASYNFSNTATQEDTFNYQALAMGVAYIFGVQITGAYRKDDSGVREIKQTIISSATQVYGPNYSLSDGAYTYFTDAWTLDPATAALWTVGAVNAIMAGYNVAL